MWSRRDFLKSAGAVYLAALSPHARASSNADEQVFATTCKFKSGTYGFVILDARGNVISRHQLPARGHDLAQCRRTGKLLVFARRPGIFAALLKANGKPVANIRATQGRHFYGHGAFHPNGKTFFTTENDYENARGVIGIYDTTNGAQKIGEFDANGVGPHDIQLSGDARHLIIANGGIETHPDFARTKLNVSSMRPNISWIGLNDGRVVASHEPPADWHKLSLRHMTVSNDDEVWIGGQLQGELDTQVPLVARATADRGLEFLHLDNDANSDLRGYVGSIELSQDGERLGISSPQANQLLVIDRHGNVMHQSKHQNICGLSPARDSKFQFSSGAGLFGRESEYGLQIDDILFDNHMISLRA